MVLRNKVRESLEFLECLEGQETIEESDLKLSQDVYDMEYRPGQYDFIDATKKAIQVLKS